MRCTHTQAQQQQKTLLLLLCLNFSRNCSDGTKTALKTYKRREELPVEPGIYYYKGLQINIIHNADGIIVVPVEPERSHLYG